MKRTLRLVTIFAVPALAIACQSQAGAPLEYMPDIDIPLDQMNTVARLYAPPEANTFRMEDVLGLVLENTSETPLIFPNDFGIRVYLREDTGWTPAPNNFGYPSGETIVLPREQQRHGGVFVDLLPGIMGQQPAVVRVVVVGSVAEGNNRTGQKVGAYIDVTLHP